MGPYVLPAIATLVVITIICSWIALARYDKKHPPTQDDDARDRRDMTRRN